MSAENVWSRFSRLNWEGIVVLVVTGATGTVGSVVLRELADAGASVRALGPRPPSSLEGVDWRPFSFVDPAGWPAAFEGATGLFLLRPPALARVARDVLPAVAYAEAAGVRRVVFLSVLGAERMPALPHRRIERWLDASGMAAVHLRAGNFMQNLITVHAADIRDRDTLVLPAGSARMSYVDARDVGAMAARCLVDADAPAADDACSPTGSVAVSHADIAAVLADVLGRPIRYRPTALPRYWAHARRTGMPLGVTAATSVLYTLARFGVGSRVTDDVARVLGRPPTDLRTFAEQHRSAWS
jgi:uncharacterized protein YbjT (DUF2867 family)